MGWNDVEAVTADRRADPLFAGAERAIVYYANTYVPEPEDPSRVIARTTYEGDCFAAAVRQQNAWGVQFHPEKSAEHGLRMVGNFLDQVRP